jgi:hypothetical protein
MQNATNGPTVAENTVLHALGTSSMYRAGVPIKTPQLMNEAHRSLRSIRALPKAREVSRVLSWADTIQRESDAEDMTVAVATLVANGLAESGPEGVALTGTGVVRALDVRPAYARQNATAAVLDRLLTPAAFSKVRAVVKSKLLTNKDESDDMVSSFLADLIRRDGFRPALANGHFPTLHNVIKFVRRSSLNYIRNQGTDVLTRLGGARTDNEVKVAKMRSTGKPVDVELARKVEIAMPGMMYVEHAKPEDTNFYDKQYADPNEVPLDELLAHEQAGERGLAALEAAMAWFQPGAASRYRTLLPLMQQGMSKYEIAEHQGISPLRASKLMTEVRRVCEARLELQPLCASILTYVKSEPCATMDDLLSDVPHASSVDMDRAVGDLVSIGLLGVDKRGSYTLTNDAI